MQRTALAALIGLGLVLSACSSSTASTSTTKAATASTIPPSTAAPTTAPQPALSSLLLTINDLPTGWSVDNSPSSSNSSGCFSQVVGSSGVPKATETFDQGGGLPELVEDIAYSPQSSKFFTEAKTQLDACKTFPVSSGGSSVQANVGAMSFPTTGDQSAAYAASFTVSGINAGFGFVLVQKGDYLMIVGLGDIGSVDADQLQTFTTTALNKLP